MAALKHRKMSADQWNVSGEKGPLPLRRRRRSVEVHALEREGKLYAEGQASRVDAAIELLASVTESSPGAAVACGWAAIEAMLSKPGDDRVLAGDRMAVLVTCSFPRAEFTRSPTRSKRSPGRSPLTWQNVALISNGREWSLQRFALRQFPP
jgi:hypothetical protein